MSSADWTIVAIVGISAFIFGMIAGCVLMATFYRGLRASE